MIRNSIGYYFLVAFLIITIFYSCQPNDVHAEMVGKGIISSVLPEFATSVDANEAVLYFNRTSPDRSDMILLVSTKENGVWSEPESLPFSDGTYRDVDPFIIADGSRLYFSSLRPIDSTSIVHDQFNTWYVDKMEDGSWSEPINPGYPLNSDSTEIFLSVADSGNIYFRTERNGIRQVMVSVLKEGQYQEPTIIPFTLEGKFVTASNPCISQDEEYLIVATRGHNPDGTPDLYVCWNNDGEWGALYNLGEKVNSEYAEFAPGLSKDGKYLYYSSERPGMVGLQAEGVRPPGDIYKIEIESILEELKLN